MKDDMEKSPYANFSVEEILRAENGAFLIQLGGEFFDYKKKYSFTIETAERFVEEIQQGLRDMLKDPAKKDKAEILTSLLNLRIIPLRFH
jgi:hypothetical protein